MGDPFGGDNISPGLYPESDDFSLADIMRRMQAKKATLQQEYTDKLNEANSIENTITPSQAFAASAIAFLPMLGGMAFGGKDKNAIVAGAAQAGGTSALSYLGDLEKERKAEKATAAAEASQRRVELDAVSKFETALPLEVFKQREMTERMKAAAGVGSSNVVPASQRLDPNDPLVQNLARKTGQKPEDINSVAKAQLAKSSFQASGAGYLPQDMSLVGEAMVTAPEATNIREARQTIRSLSKNVPRLSAIMQNSGQFISTYSTGTPEEKMKIGQDIQVAANVLLDLRAAIASNPIFTGPKSDRDMALIDKALLSAPGADPTESFVQFLKTSSDVEKGRLAELYQDAVRKYESRLMGRVTDPLLEEFFAVSNAGGGGQDQRAALLQEAQQLRQAIAAARGSPTPTPSPIPGGNQ